jgi:hypothetical protein
MSLLQEAKMASLADKIAEEAELNELESKKVVIIKGKKKAKNEKSKKSKGK